MSHSSATRAAFEDLCRAHGLLEVPQRIVAQLQPSLNSSTSWLATDLAQHVVCAGGNFAYFSGLQTDEPVVLRAFVGSGGKEVVAMYDATVPGSNAADVLATIKQHQEVMLDHEQAQYAAITAVHRAMIDTYALMSHPDMLSAAPAVQEAFTGLTPFIKHGVKRQDTDLAFNALVRCCNAIRHVCTSDKTGSDFADRSAAVIHAVEAVRDQIAAVQLAGARAGQFTALPVVVRPAHMQELDEFMGSTLRIHVHRTPSGTLELGPHPLARDIVASDVLLVMEQFDADSGRLFDRSHSINPAETISNESASDDTAQSRAGFIRSRRDQLFALSPDANAHVLFLAGDALNVRHIVLMIDQLVDPENNLAIVHRQLVEERRVSEMVQSNTVSHPEDAGGPPV